MKFALKVKLGMVNLNMLKLLVTGPIIMGCETNLHKIMGSVFTLVKSECETDCLPSLEKVK